LEKGKPAKTQNPAQVNPARSASSSLSLSPDRPSSPPHSPLRPKYPARPSAPHPRPALTRPAPSPSPAPVSHRPAPRAAARPALSISAQTAGPPASAHSHARLLPAIWARGVSARAARPVPPSATPGPRVSALLSPFLPGSAQRPPGITGEAAGIPIPPQSPALPFLTPAAPRAPPSHPAGPAQTPPPQILERSRAEHRRAIALRRRGPAAWPRHSPGQTSPPPRLGTRRLFELLGPGPSHASP
jgi:hypothetical protein